MLSLRFDDDDDDDCGEHDGDDGEKEHSNDDDDDDDNGGGWCGTKRHNSRWRLICFGDNGDNNCIARTCMFTPSICVFTNHFPNSIRLTILPLQIGAHDVDLHVK